MRLMMLAAAVAAVAGGAAAQPPSAPCAPYARQIAAYRLDVRTWLAAEHIPGATVGFTKGACTWIEGFGQADLEHRVPATAASVYRFASTQKPMTATAVLQLAASGRLDLDAPIQRYVRYFPLKPHPITVRQLLGHLGGIAHYPDPARTRDLTVHLTTREAIALFADAPLVAEPGTRFNYTTFGYDLLGAAIEGASGQPYAAYMRAHVWAPAGMAATRLDDPAAIVPDRVHGYEEGRDGQLRNARFVDLSNRFAGGGAMGTVGDMLRFGQALNAGRLLDRRSLALLYTPMRTRDGAVAGFPHTRGYAMGWNVEEQGGHRFFHHDGGQPGASTFLLNAPDRDFTLAMAYNIEKGAGPAIMFRLYELILGEKIELPR